MRYCYPAPLTSMVLTYGGRFSAAVPLKSRANLAVRESARDSLGAESKRFENRSRKLENRKQENKENLARVKPPLARSKQGLQIRLERVSVLKPDDFLAECSLPIVEHRCR